MAIEEIIVTIKIALVITYQDRIAHYLIMNINVKEKVIANGIVLPVIGKVTKSRKIHKIQYV